ncbi:MAG: enoyl-CoA hydratase/isomerase family protein [Bdellovibrionaceae bacterium]|nr:enoyl-CoA hydratase/isomerase family protein [Pseudobdellovibrionaceae bacterium]
MALELRLENGLLRLTLNAPARGNSFGLQDAEQLMKILKSREAQAARGLVLEASGRLFCAGGNLDDYAKMKSSAQGKAVNRKINSALRALSLWPGPTVAVVTGDCFGGGVEVVSAFDHVVSVPEAMFGLWQRRIGLSYGWGGGARLEERLGRAALKRLALSARSFSAYEAQTMGLVDEVHLRSMLESRALEWMDHMASLPKAPVAGLKTFEPKSEQRLFERLWWNPEHRSVLARRRSR